MIDEMQTLIDNYTRWLKDKTILRKVDETWIEVTTPHLDRHNDCLRFYIRKENDGYIINDLIASGCSVDSPKRKKLLTTTLAGFGVRVGDGDRLLLKTTPQNFSLKKHNFLQAMPAVNDLFYLTSPYLSSLFYEEVTQWLNLANIRYIQKIKLTGKSGYDHMFDFIIPKSPDRPERPVHTMNNPQKAGVEAPVFNRSDTQDTRPTGDTQLYAFLNDSESNVANLEIEALKNYAVKPIV